MGDRRQGGHIHRVEHEALQRRGGSGDDKRQRQLGRILGEGRCDLAQLRRAVHGEGGGIDGEAALRPYAQIGAARRPQEGNRRIAPHREAEEGGRHAIPGKEVLGKNENLQADPPAVILTDIVLTIAGRQRSRRPKLLTSLPLSSRPSCPTSSMSTYAERPGPGHSI